MSSEVSTAPHIVTDTDTSKIMKMVILSLVPAGLVGVYVFGLKAFVLILTCMIASTLFEYIYNKLMKKEQTAWDCSAALTGMLIAYNVPSSLPIPMAIVGCFVAINHQNIRFLGQSHWPRFHHRQVPAPHGQGSAFFIVPEYGKSAPPWR